MRAVLSTFALVGALSMTTTAVSAEQTVIFAVDGMYCAACPYIVQSSMAAVPGVAEVVVSFEAQTATVTFDDGKTSAEEIAAASANAGYPAHPKQQGS
jgi:mercuric ion binding protein